MNGPHKLEGARPVASVTRLRQPRRRAPLDDTQLLDTQHAFDSVAADYDGPRGNNELIQRMRLAM